MKFFPSILPLVLFCAIAFAQSPDISAWAYQLQEIDIDEIVAATDFDLIVIDYSSDGTASGEWSYAQIATIRTSGKIVLSYISIGEAEDYRWYWDTAWESSPPPWFGPENPDWAGNYKVRFWFTDWQEIVFSYLDRIIAQGFDGAYLDIVDAYYYWLVENPEQPFADTLMIHFIERINDYADSVAGCNFYIFPQNGESVLDEDNITPAQQERYFAAIEGIGVEDVFFYGDEDENNPLEPDDYRIAILDDFIPRGKFVLSIEYLTLTELIAVYLDSAFAHTYYPYATRRALDTLYNGFPTDIADRNQRPNAMYLGISPNPFNSSCAIAVNVGDERARPTTIEIYDLRGNVVYVPSPGSAVPNHPLPQAGEGNPSFSHSMGEGGAQRRMREFIWHPDPTISSGIYLVKVRTKDGNCTTKRIVYLR